MTAHSDLREQSEYQNSWCSEQGHHSITDFDLHLFNEGKHYRLYEKLGAHFLECNGQTGVHFGVWAPNAEQVSVIGDFNQWDGSQSLLRPVSDSGIWTGFFPGVNAGSAYQYRLVSLHQGRLFDRPDPFALRQSGSPAHHSFVWPLEFQWQDGEWMASRQTWSEPSSPITIYQVHLASWMRVPEEGNRWLTFAEVAPKLADHLSRLGFTHLELLPIMQQPAHGGQLHRISGHFAPAAHYGTPQDLMCLVDCLHQQGIAVLLGWLPAYFPADDSGLAFFDGTYLYEKGPLPVDVPAGGQAYCFDVSKPQVRSFLTSTMMFWLDKYHFDGVRAMEIDSLLHLDYGRKPGDWLPNVLGGRENLDGVEFLRNATAAVAQGVPDAIVIAHESTSWPMVSHAQQHGGLGFNYKLDTSFEERSIRYFGQDSLYRKIQHHELTTGLDSTFSERFVLPLSARTKGHGNGSLLARMAGDEWQRFANLRLLLGYLYLQPGKKLLFMGTELAQWREWNPSTSLDWHLVEVGKHDAIQRWVGDLNRVYRCEAALHSSDHWPEGFEWVDRNDAERSTFSWLRCDPQRRDVLLCILNCTPVVRRNFQVGVRRPGNWREILNSDAKLYGGSGQGNLGQSQTAPFSFHGLPHMLTITLPPLGMVVFKHEP